MAPTTILRIPNPPFDSPLHPRTRPRTPAKHLLPLALAILLAAQTLPAKSATPDTYTGPDQGFWSDPANWTAGTPNSAAFDAYLSNPTGLTTLLDASETINNLFITSPNTLTLQPATTLTLSGPTLTNSGAILLNATASLFFASNTTLSGAGAIQLLAPGSLITGNTFSSNNVITGQGAIIATNFTNAGTISATANTLTLSMGTLTNSGLLVASGGLLNLNCQMIDNGGGTIEVAGGDASIAGTINGGTIKADAATTLTNGFFSNVTFLGPMAISSPDTYFTGFTTNNGSLTLHQTDNESYFEGTLKNAGVIDFSGEMDVNANLSGGGTLLLRPWSYIFLNNSPAVSSDNTVLGQGTIDLQTRLNVGLTNTGSIIATGLLDIPYNNNFSNEGLLRADSGTLVLAGELTNSDGIVDAIHGGIVSVYGSVAGGTLTGTGGSILLSGFGMSLQDVTLAGSVVETLGPTVRFGPSPNLTLNGVTHLFGTLSISPHTLNLSSTYGTVSIDGTGSLLLPQNSTVMLGSDLIITGNSLLFSGGVLTAPSDTLNNPPRHLTVAGSVSGFGTIGNLEANGSLNSWTNTLFISNSGRITAEGGTLGIAANNSLFYPPIPLPMDSLVNSGTLAANAGTLLIYADIDNSGGIISATDGGSVICNGSVSGGTVTASPDSSVTLPLASLQSVVLTGPAFVSALDLNGTLNFSQSLTATPSFLWRGLVTSFTGGGTLTFPGMGSITNNTFSTQNALIVDHGSLTLFNGSCQVDAPIYLVDGQLTLCDTTSNGSLKSIEGSGTVTFGPPPNSGFVLASRNFTSDALRVTSLNVSGTLTLRSGDGTAGTSQVNSLLLSTNSSNLLTATLDLTDNAFILQSDPANPSDKRSKIAQVFSALQSARETGPSGPWTGTGITSATAAADPAHLTVAMFDNADLGLSTWGGQKVDTNSLLITSTPIADATLDGTVDASDFNAWYTHRLTDSYSYAAGDFNMDGVVDGQDFTIWYNAIGPTTANPILQNLNLDPTTLAALRAAPVPEPASLATLLLAPFLLRRKRKARMGKPRQI